MFHFNLVNLLITFNIISIRTFHCFVGYLILKMIDFNLYLSFFVHVGHIHRFIRCYLIKNEKSWVALAYDPSLGVTTAPTCFYIINTITGFLLKNPCIYQHFVYC